jgi:hypothetical protein
MTATEAFPLLSTTNTDKLGPLSGLNSSDKPRRRRSSGLGGEINAGDTSSPALATLDVRPPSAGTIKVRSNASAVAVPLLTSRRHKQTEIARNHFRKGEKRKLSFSNGKDMLSNIPGLPL